MSVDDYTNLQVMSNGNCNSFFQRDKALADWIFTKFLTSLSASLIHTAKKKVGSTCSKISKFSISTHISYLK